jgi:tetratricopeptide (TPR) repeat protein
MSLGTMQGYRANLDASLRHFQRARDFFERGENRPKALRALLKVGEIYRQKGDFTRARQYFEAAHDGAALLELPHIQSSATANLGLVALSMERYDLAQAQLLSACELADRITDAAERLALQCELHCALASVAMAKGSLDDAEAQCYTALWAAERLGQPLSIGWANRTMGQIVTGLIAAQRAVVPITTQKVDETQEATLARSDDPDDYFRAAIDAFQELKADGEVARTMYTQALSLITRGRGATAARKLQQAMILFTRLGMNDDAAKAAKAQMDAIAAR